MRWEIIKNRRNLTTLEKENVIVNHSQRKNKSTSKKKKKIVNKKIGKRRHLFKKYTYKNNNIPEWKKNLISMIS